VDKRTSQADRRRQTLGSVIYGGLNPRRTLNRRPADDQKYVLDWHDQGLFTVAMAIVLMSCIDAFFTLNLMRLGAQEINYFMNALLNADTSSFLLVKFTLTSIGVVWLVAFARFRLGGILPVRRVLESLCAMYACLIIWELYLLSVVAVQML
jgi:Domain of unknown function (DUF5658)